MVGLFVLLWALPVTLVPYPVICAYGYVLQLVEPIMLFQEVLFVILIATELFSYINELAEDDDEDNSYLYTAGFALFSLLNYAVALHIFLLYFNHSWLLHAILIAAIFNHVFLWSLGSGQLWEVAFTFMLSMVIFLTMNEEMHLKQNIEELASLSDLDSKDSLIEFVYSLWQMTLDKLKHVQNLLGHFLTPVFVVSFFLRLFSVNWFRSITPSFLKFSGDDDDDEDIFKEGKDLFAFNCSEFQPSLVCKLCAIFVVTQLVTGHFYQLTGHGSITQQDWLKRLLPNEVLIGRVSQIILVNILLQHSIYKRWLEND